MPKPTKHLNYRETIAIREIILSPENKGLSARIIYEKHPEFTHKTVKNWCTRLRRDPTDMGRYGEDFRKILQLLKDAKEQNLNIYQLMDEYPDIKKDIFDINDEMTILPVDGVFKASREKQIEILKYVRDNGVMATIRQYADLKVYKRELIEWNNTLKIYQLSKPKIEIDNEYIINILKEAKEYNISTGGFGGIKAMAKKYNISAALLYKENGLRNLVQRHHTNNKSRVPKDIQQMIVDSVKPNTRLIDLSRIFGYGPETIKRVLEEHDYICNSSGIHLNSERQR